MAITISFSESPNKTLENSLKAIRYFFDKLDFSFLANP